MDAHHHPVQEQHDEQEEEEQCFRPNRIVGEKREGTKKTLIK